MANSLMLFGAGTGTGADTLSSTDTYEATASSAVVLDFIVVRKAATTPSSGTVVSTSVTSTDVSGSWAGVGVELRPLASQPATATPAALAATATVRTPTVSTGQAVTPATLAAAATFPAPVVSGSANATPATVAATVSVPAPTLFTGGNTTVPAPSIAATVSIPAPTIARGTTAAPATVAAVVSVPVPKVVIPVDTTVSPPPLAVAATVLPPILDLPRLPGALITRDGQLEYDGYLLGGGTPYRLLGLAGWDDTPGVDSGNMPKPAQHGSWPGSKYGQERFVTFTGLLKAPKALMADYVDAFVEGTPISEGAEELPLAIRTLDGVTRLVYGHVINRSLPLDKLYRLGLGQIAVQWVCSDPRRYGIDIQTADLARGSSIQVTNIGNTPTHPTLRINGPATNPVFTIVQSGRKLGFNIALGPGEWIDVDCKAGRALWNGETNVLAGRTADSVPPQLFVFPRGVSTLTYAASGGAVPVANVLHRDAWM
ncbi:phage tail family protein [Microtetraspora sp. AC03309]|uniref:phage tail domain-containing protein n=1 Tax=Microtetraspora sp. AC03309 TaxID=2779376 RepID=UPI001E314CF1|nr:phage tail domain-containing protein [Microtetraspora sp. AC03309]MCC5580576.1 phage tail family protein [Microtetraspora sp. AC03309]